MSNIESTWEKCVRLANDKSTTSHERAAARRKAAELRGKIDKMAARRARENLNLNEEEAKLVKQYETAKKQSEDNACWLLGQWAFNNKRPWSSASRDERLAKIFGVSLSFARAAARRWRDGAERRATTSSC